MTTLRNLPSIEQLLQTETTAQFIARFGRPLTLDALRQTLDDIRARFKLNPEAGVPSTEAILTQAESTLTAWTTSTLHPVINATGVILHTNLGRAPMSDATIHAMDLVSRSYSNLEFDLETGKRGSRLIHAESILQKLTGAEAALVVNNCASAVLLTLSALANKKRVVIARSQLVEIGGGFRVPDVMKQSGAKLVEVGTTNKVRTADYAAEFEEPTALVMRAHRSNFKIVGFTEEPNFKDIVDAAHKAGVPVVDDLGSGALYDTAKYGFSHEPTVQESMQAGADVILFSGDKLLGGPQAGIIIGRKALLDKIKKHPLARAVRADKACLAGLSATLTHYLKDEAEREIPILKMMSLTLKQVQGRAEAWRAALGQGVVIEGRSTVGGGSLPEESIPTYLLELQVKSADKFLRALRRNSPPIIARTENDKVLLDPRTVLPEQEGALLVGLKNCLKP
ncbi:MAG: L-seryl-tRNA(Sec) selenium transferase [Anaerolineales bacterium]|uniref:L-seryl-tRNA(Sec) selenium transferase n=1 Tax=Candidatus Villigracilis vicinus TaxID=3140679 RepID=UPI003135FA00|nr:L-seryl-tRNA(Sec) selenium transferase [Anaerolineales bacterium]MBK7447888.1 L-seryl-tRNA(Sec) selenium transferase [Anaerolineales bacterium]MBK9779259.1 L-seryl-tRNA(Sec) selenium transferase [Anaerolineales bacterium]